MPYLGNDLQVAQPSYRNIDDISGSFNSSTTSFPLLVSGSAPVPFPINSNQCLISVAGVVQRPDDSGTEGFRISGGNIIFSSAPSTGADFFGVILAGADYVNVGANFPSGSAAAPSITFDSDLDTGIYNSAANQVSVSTAGSERLRIDSAGQVEVVSLGTASAPAFSFTTDSNTGIYSPGADQVAISTNGSGRLFVDSSGRVGVGTSSPSVAVHVSGASNSAAQLRSSNTASGVDTVLVSETTGVLRTNTNHSLSLGTNSTTALTIDTSQRVGIGTTSPVEKLHVAGEGIGIDRSGGDPYINFYTSGTSNNVFLYGGASTGFRVFVGGSERTRVDTSGRLLVGTSSAPTTPTGSSAAVFAGYNNGGTRGTTFTYNEPASSAGPRIALTKSRANNTTGFDVVSSGDEIGMVSFQGADGSGLIEGARITAFVDGTPGANDMPGRLVFSTTADGASSPTERARITAAGALKAASGGAAYIGTGSGYDAVHELVTNNNGYEALIVTNRNSSSPLGVQIFYATDVNNTANLFLGCYGSSTLRAGFRSNGGLANYQANNVNLSDRNAKKDISPTAGTWDCIKEWEIVNYRYKDQPDDADLNLGVIAQQVAESCPEVITVFEEAKDDQPEKLGVKEQQMYWMAIKALQEAQVRIETLEAKVAALEAA